MKNVVLVTWKGGENYGTCLQSFALYKKLCLLGYHVSFFSGSPEKYSFNFYKYLILLWIKKKKKNIQDKKREEFQSEVFNEIVPFTPWQEKKMVSETDCFVTGSDQIWNTYNCFSAKSFLSFAGEKKRVAYASSIGTNSIKFEYQGQVKQYLTKFAHIGVREVEAVKVLSKLTGRRDIIQVLDPTFLLTPEEWKQVTCKAVYEMQLPKDYILCYLIGQNDWYEKQLLDVRNKLGIENVIIIPAAENKSFSCNNTVVYKNASPIEFVDLLQRAKYVCTDSFHATALCINHSVPFVEFMRFMDDDIKSQNSRIYDVLTHYDLMNRIYSVDSLEWTKQINFQNVQRILTKDRKQSTEYLINAIEH